MGTSALRFFFNVFLYVKKDFNLSTKLFLSILVVGRAFENFQVCLFVAFEVSNSKPRD